MYHKDHKSFLLFGKQLNQIIAILQMMSDKNPDIQPLNEFIQYLKDMNPYDDMLNGFIFGDQELDVLISISKSSISIPLNEI